MNRDEMTEFIVQQRKFNKKMFNEFLRLEANIRNMNQGGPLGIMNMNSNYINTVNSISEILSNDEYYNIKNFDYLDIVTEMQTQIETNKILVSLISEFNDKINEIKKSIRF